MIKVWSCWRTRGLYPAHAVALAGEISGAQLVMIDQLGHVPAPASFPTILPAVLSGVSRCYSQSIQGQETGSDDDGRATHPDGSRSENYLERAVLDAEAGAAGMSVVIPTAGSSDLDLIVVPVTGDVFGQGDAVTALPKLCGKVQVIGSQESSGETLMA